MAQITSNNPFPNQPNVRKGTGPVYYSWKPQPSQKIQITSKQNGCNGKVDNNVTYVYNTLPNGNHSPYVFCDYVV